MPKGTIEHANISVTDPARSAKLLEEMLGWHTRWEGESMNNGHTIHIGDETNYMALYTSDRVTGDYSKGQPLNHVGFVVDDLDGAERIVEAHGLEPFGHDDYDPGKRFYFFDWDGIEFEVASYTGDAS
ncbi:VOC family protein [Erythrobacter sp. HA6-11]